MIDLSLCPPLQIEEGDLNVTIMMILIEDLLRARHLPAFTIHWLWAIMHVFLGLNLRDDGLSIN